MSYISKYCACFKLPWSIHFGNMPVVPRIVLMLDRCDFAEDEGKEKEKYDQHLHEVFTSLLDHLVALQNSPFSALYSLLLLTPCNMTFMRHCR